MKAVAEAATADLIIRQMNKENYWMELISNKASTVDYVNAFMGDIARKIIKTKAFQNVYKKSTGETIAENMLKEARRLGTEKELLAITSVDSVMKSAAKIHKEMNQPQAGNVPAPAPQPGR